MERTADGKMLLNLPPGGEVVHVALPRELVEFIDEGLRHMVETDQLVHVPLELLRQNWMTVTLVRGLGMVPEAPHLEVVH